MGAVNKIIIRTADDAALVWQFLKQNAAASIERGTPLQVVISKYRATRSNEQNAFYWGVLLTPASEQIAVNGQHFLPDTWNTYLKRKFLPETCSKGVDKWEELPDGARELVMSTSDLNVEEMTLYLQEAEAHLVDEFGVRIPTLET